MPTIAEKAEYKLIETFATDKKLQEQKGIIPEILHSRELNWGEILEQCIRNKILPLAAQILTGLEYRNSIPKFVLLHLESSLDQNRIKTELFRNAALEVGRTLLSEKISFVVTKGIVFESILYGGNGSRSMNDIDFMILPADREKVRSVMKGLGYFEGIFDWNAGEVKPHNRKDKIIYELNPDHLPIFAKLTGENLIRCVHVDFANSLTWEKSEFNVPVESAMEENFFYSLPGSGSFPMPCFGIPYQFIFTILHFFREAWLERWMSWEQDVNLIKFFDVMRLWDLYKNELIRKDFTDLLRIFGIEKPVAWVLVHIDRAFQSKMAEELGLGQVVSEEFLRSSLASGGKLIYWKGDMRNRIYSKNRKDLFYPEA